MTNKGLATGTVHKLPEDLQKAIISTPAAMAVWEDITPLARNEWICWVTSGKKAETRSIRTEKALSKLTGGMRRPCCWEGCTHRSIDTVKTCSRGHKYQRSGSCPICWPGKRRRRN